MQPRSLDAWLSYIERQHPAGMHLGLERMAQVLSRLDLVRPAPVVITVAGTNGKGSTIAFLEAIYREAGYRTGAYTSPHLNRYNERVRIAGAEVDDEALCQAFEAVERARGDCELTYFEFATAAAFVLFRAAAIDVALLEVGLGGRLDAVNAVDADAAVVVSIGLDHVEWLGPTREDIGWEKAHVYRGARPAICADTDPPARLLDHARHVGAELKLIGRDFRIVPIDAAHWRWEGWDGALENLPVPRLVGRFQLQNAAAAVAVVRSLSDRLAVPTQALQRAIGQVVLPGRMQVVPGPVSWVFDVAHNVPAATALAEALVKPSTDAAGHDAGAPAARRTLAVFGIMHDKDVAGVVEAMAPVVDVWFAASLPPPRGLSAAALGDLVEAAVGVRPAEFGTVAQACAAAQAEAVDGDRIVVFGSFLTVGPGLTALAAD